MKSAELVTDEELARFYGAAAGDGPFWNPGDDARAHREGLRAVADQAITLGAAAGMDSFEQKIDRLTLALERVAVAIEMMTGDEDGEEWKGDAE